MGIVVAGFVPPPSPAETAVQIQQLYRSNATAIGAGMVLMTLGAPFLAAWGCAITAQASRTEKGLPILTCLQLMAIGIGTLIAMVIPMIWAVAAFRPGDIDAATTQTLNDIGFFLFLFPWTALALWVVPLAAAILRDASETPVFPRWAAYLNLLAAILSFPGGLVVFAKRGSLAYNGVLAFYLPVVVLFAWMIAMSALTLKAIREDDASRDLSGLASEPAGR
ncbi:MAG: hypothetical protein ACYDH6_23270 [Acidimicrobiales bacterium]